MSEALCVSPTHIQAPASRPPLSVRPKTSRCCLTLLGNDLGTTVDRGTGLTSRVEVSNLTRPAAGHPTTAGSRAFQQSLVGRGPILGLGAGVQWRERRELVVQLGKSSNIPIAPPTRAGCKRQEGEREAHTWRSVQRERMKPQQAPRPALCKDTQRGRKPFPSCNRPEAQFFGEAGAP